MKKNIMILAIITTLIIVIVFSKEKIQLQPDCSIQPNNINCKCYDETLRVEIDNGYICIIPKCSNLTAEIDCKNNSHIQCVGQWTCPQYECVYLCTK